jgi:hypothetical protein
MTAKKRRLINHIIGQAHAAGYTFNEPYVRKQAAMMTPEELHQEKKTLSIDVWQENSTHSNQIS